LIIIGIDPGSVITGTGIIEISGNKISLLEFDTLKMSSKEAMSDRLKKVYDFCISKIIKYKPNEFAIETAFFGKNIQSTLKLGQVRGSAIVAAKNYKLKISEYSPREIKKSVTGNGASSKQQVLSIVKSILSIKEKPKFYDASDALSIALCHFFCISRNTLYPVELKNKISTKTGWKEYIAKNPGKILNKRT
jgi:crossover junction endodeoxyribonuclease RuvC